MGYLSQKFEGVALFLEGIFVGIGRAEHFERIGLDLAGLAFAHRLYEASVDMDSGTGGDSFELLVGESLHIKHDLDIVDRRAVVESNKLHMLVASAGAYPAHDAHVAPDERGSGEEIGYLGSFHCYGLDGG